MMSKRRAKQHRRKFKRKHPSWVNYSAFVGGLAITLCATFLVFSTVFPTLPQDLDLNSGAGQEAKTSDLNQNNGFEYSLAVSNSSELKEMLAEISKVDPGEGLPLYFERQRKRIRIAEQLLMLKIDEKTRLLAVQAKLGAHSNLFNATLKHQAPPPEILQQMRSAAEKHVDDFNSDIRRLAKTALWGVDLFESVIEEELPFAVEEQADKLLSLVVEFPQNEGLRFNLLGMLVSLENYKPEMALEMREQLIQRIEEFHQLDERDLVIEFSDSLKLKSTGFREKMEKLSTAPSPLVEEMVQLSIGLAADPMVGIGVMKELNVFGNWLENQKKLDQAKEIYRTLLDSVDSRNESGTTEIARELATKGLTRSNAIGNRAIVTGISLNDSSFWGHDFGDLNLVIIFWQQSIELQSNRIEKHLAEISGISPETPRFKVLLVEIEPQEMVLENPLIQKFPDAVFVNWAEGPEQERLKALLEYYPVNIVPRAIIIDSEGYLVQSNLQLQNLAATLEAMYDAP